MSKIIEVEGSEIALRNKAGDVVIIPKKYRLEVEGMIKEGCHGCIDNLVETLPVMEDYADDGNLIPRKYTAQKDNLTVNNNIRPLETFNSNKLVQPDIPVLRADARTDTERKIDKDYTDKVLNPSINQQIAEGLQKPLRWVADPVKGVGDIISAVAPKSALAQDLPNTSEDSFEYRKKQLNPYTSGKEKLNNTINEARDLTINSLINAGTMELGFALPRSFVSPAMTNMFKVGSKANFAADLLQLSKTNLDKLEEGDMNEVANLVLNSSSLLSKMDNFDASTVYNNIKNWKNISKADKIDTYKDIFNISQSINQQTQRNEK